VSSSCQAMSAAFLAKTFVLSPYHGFVTVGSKD
jgi:hypothetical protein